MGLGARTRSKSARFRYPLRSGRTLACAAIRVTTGASSGGKPAAWLALAVYRRAPLAIVTIATGAFAHLLYWLRLDGVPISLDDVAHICSEHVLELARFVEQCSPPALLRVGSLIAGSPVGVASVRGSALLVALSGWRRRPPSSTAI